MAKVSWEIPFLEALSTDSVTGMLDVLEKQSTDHAKTPNTAVKQYALKLIEKTYKSQPDKIYDLGVRFVNTDNHTAHELGSVMVGEHYGEHPESVTSMLYTLADSSNWEVREWVADVCGNILSLHFDAFYRTMVEWSFDNLPNVRRAVALAAMYAGRSRNQAFAEPLLDLIEPLLNDQDSYVKKNLGPFAIGSGLLRYYPENVLNRLHKWVQCEDEMTRWNVAMVFSAAEGAKHPQDANVIMKLLREDVRRPVQKAVESAIKNLRKRLPDQEFSVHNS